MTCVETNCRTALTVRESSRMRLRKDLCYMKKGTDW